MILDILHSETCEGILWTEVPDADVRAAAELHLVTAAQPRLEIQTILGSDQEMSDTLRRDV